MAFHFAHSEIHPLICGRAKSEKSDYTTLPRSFVWTEQKKCKRCVEVFDRCIDAGIIGLVNGEYVPAKTAAERLKDIENEANARS